jgi:hypothetical protein
MKDQIVRSLLLDLLLADSAAVAAVVEFPVPAVVAVATTVAVVETAGPVATLQDGELVAVVVPSMQERVQPIQAEYVPVTDKL